MQIADHEISVDPLVRLLREELGATDVSVNTAPPPAVCDLLVRATIDGRLLRLAIDTTTRDLYPRDVREMIRRLRDSAAQIDAIPMVYATSLSAGARSELQNQQAAYADADGNVHLRHDGLFIRIDRPRTKKQSRKVRSLFTSARAPVLSWLLEHSNDPANIVKLASATGVSSATVGQILRELENRDLLITSGKGPNKKRRLSDPGRLLDEWASVSKPVPPEKSYFVPIPYQGSLLGHLGETFNQHHIAYAVGWEHAAQQHAPHLTEISVVRCRVLDISGADHVVRTIMNGQPVLEGANLHLYKSSSGDLMQRDLAGQVSIARPLRAYLDLVHGPGRSKDLAEHLRREILKA